MTDPVLIMTSDFTRDVRAWREVAPDDSERWTSNVNVILTHDQRPAIVAPSQPPPHPMNETNTMDILAQAPTPVVGGLIMDCPVWAPGL